MVLVVANHTLGRTHNLSVHINSSKTSGSTGIKCIPGFRCVPFVLAQPVVILGIYNCELTLC